MTDDDTVDLRFAVQFNGRFVAFREAVEKPTFL